MQSTKKRREALLRIFIRHDAPLSDGSALAAGSIIDRSGCDGKPMRLTICGRAFNLANVGMREVSAGDQLRFISAAGKTHDQTFSESGILIDFPLPDDLVPLARKATLRRHAIGVSTIFKTLASRGRFTTDARFDGISLTANRTKHDQAAEFFLIEI